MLLRSTAVLPSPINPEAVAASTPEAEVPDQLAMSGTVTKAPMADAAKSAAEDGTGEAGVGTPDVMVLHVVLPEVRPAASSVVPESLLEPAADAMKSDADGQDMRKRKKRRMTTDSVVESLSSSFPMGSGLGPDVPEETNAAMDEASVDMRAFCSTIRRLGLSVEPGFTVGRSYPCSFTLYFYIISCLWQ